MEKKTKKKIKKKQYINNDALFVQALLTVLVIITVIVSFFSLFVLLITEFFLALDLLVVAYNNSTSYGRKYMSLIYTVVGLIILGIVIYNYVMVFI